ncbi:MAG: hypothetical protein ACK4LQ_05815 [Pararhodobacter sp.]
MPLPILPLAVPVLKYGGVALAAWLLARRLAPAIHEARIDQRAEDALDDLPEGLGARHPIDREQHNLAGRYRRRIHVPGLDRTIEIDAAFIARLRARTL